MPSVGLPNTRAEVIPRAPTVPKINEENESGTSSTNTSTGLSPASNRGPRSDVLTVTVGPGVGTIYRLKFGETWIGRSDDCDIIIPATGVSRRHAWITLSKTRVVLRDNKAKNGTFVNDKQVSEHALKPGEEIQIGHVTLLYSQNRGMDELERQKAQSIASMVAGVAHQLNTPLGVANTANALIESLADELRGAPVSERVAELLGDLRASAGLVSKNLKRTDELVKTFKQLSARELVDDRRECDLASIVADAIEGVRPATERQGVTVVASWAADESFPWVGYPRSLYKVIEHLLQNSLRYGYGRTRTGLVDIRLKPARGRYRLEVEDYGIGVERQLQARLFEPFVTSDRESGAGGLGLAIVHTIVTSLLRGTITCNSTPGKGTKFIIIIPTEIEDDVR
jgi:signal transduction histidine kinase